jgi:hypothetical protein
MLHDLSPVRPAKLLYVLSYSDQVVLPYAYVQRHQAKMEGAKLKKHWTTMSRIWLLRSWVKIVFLSVFEINDFIPEPGPLYLFLKVA